MILIRIGEVFEVKSGIIGSKQNIYEDVSSSETDLSSDTSEVNGILPSKIHAKENLHTPTALISFNDDRGYNQTDIFSNESRQGMIPICYLFGNLKLYIFIKAYKHCI